MIGIRREDKNPWERRSPLTPDHVADLSRTHRLRFRVQPSPLRVFPDIDFAAAGAELAEDLSPCRTILGIKEIPPGLLLPERTYVFFSHTTKGQAYNMPMLRRILELRCTLVDYERIVDDRGRRLVFFGRHAGHAGMIDTLWALGRRLALEGLRTGLEELRLAHEYSSLDEATHHITRVGERVRHVGLPDSLHPLVFAFTGSGNVTRGALEIFDRLPTQELFPEDLARLASDPLRPRNVFYGVHLDRPSRYERRDGAPFDPDDLRLRPERYRSATPRWLPHVTVIVNGAFWDPALPRLVTRDDLRALYGGRAAPRLRVIADIACDIGGGCEATVRASTPGDPVYVYDPDRGDERSGIEGRGPVVLAVDNLPCELPVESSEHFGDALLRYVPALDRCPWDEPIEALGLPGEIVRAIVAHRGELAPGYNGLAAHLDGASDDAGGAP